MSPPDRPDPDALILGEVPLRREGVPSYAELRKRVTDPEQLAQLDERELAERKARLGTPRELIAYYTDGAAAFHHILPERRLRLSAFERMHDPRENKEWAGSAGHLGPYGSAGSLEDVRKAIEAAPRIDLRTVMDQADFARMRHTKLLCLAGDTTVRSPQEDFHRAYARPRMWEQYADNHTGACLLFNPDELRAIVVPQLEDQGRTWTGNVAYDNTAIQAAGVDAYHLSYNKLLAAGGGSIEAGVIAHLEQHHRLLFFTKMEDYREEREVRYVLYDGKDELFAHVEYGDSLRAVVLGVDFPAAMLRQAAEACASWNVPVRRMAWPNYGPVALPLG